MSSAIETHDRQQTQAAGRMLAALLRPGDVIALVGDLGAGKTTLVQGVAAGLGVIGPVTSPTFNLLLVHEGRLALNHFDLYRFDHARQLEDIDFWGVMESGGVSLIEWGDRFPAALPDDYLQVSLERVGEMDRRIHAEGHGTRGKQLARAWLEALGTKAAS